MDNYRYEISEKIKTLSVEKQLIFGALICEKLFPNYQYFSELTLTGNPNILQNAISLIFKKINDDKLVSKQILEKIKVELDDLMPNTEEFDTILASFALDACCSAYSCICFLLNPKIENIIDIAIYARDTVDMYIQEKDDLLYDDKLFELKIENHFFMKLEKERQNKVVSKLKESNIISDLFLDELRLVQPLPIIEIDKINL